MFMHTSGEFHEFYDVKLKRNLLSFSAETTDEFERFATDCIRSNEIGSNWQLSNGVCVWKTKSPVSCHGTPYLSGKKKNIATGKHWRFKHTYSTLQQSECRISLDDPRSGGVSRLTTDENDANKKTATGRHTLFKRNTIRGHLNVPNVKNQGVFYGQKSTKAFHSSPEICQFLAYLLVSTLTAASDSSKSLYDSTSVAINLSSYFSIKYSI